jgi:hypothetical protein
VATWFSVTLSVIFLFLKIYPPFQVANYSALPGLSSLKIKSDETNLFCLKLQKKEEFENVTNLLIVLNLKTVT